MRIAFIGGGHMASSLIGGLIARGTPATQLCVADPAPQQLERLRREYAVRVTTEGAEAVRDADLVVLAVKPQHMAGAARGIAGELASRRRIVVSVAAGITLASLEAWLGAGCALVRTMPNRPALIGAGITAAIAAPGVTTAERAAVERVLTAVGALVWLEEETQMDAVTAVSGSGPAYFFLLVEALEAAGITLASLEAWLGAGCALVRTMPNRPALIGAGITAAIAAPGVTTAERAAVERVLAAVGALVWLEEETQMDAVTAVSGSGPAYFFLLVEALEDAGTGLGLPRETAHLLAVHTALGAGRMAVESPDPPAVLREQVTSRGGTTAAALAVLEEAGVRATLQRAVAAAARRSAELAREFGGG